MEHIRWYRTEFSASFLVFHCSLRCQAPMILNIFSVIYSKMSVVGIEPAHLRSVSLCFTNEPHSFFLIKSKITVCTCIKGIKRYSSQVELSVSCKGKRETKLWNWKLRYINLNLCILFLLHSFSPISLCKLLQRSLLRHLISIGLCRHSSHDNIKQFRY